MPRRTPDHIFNYSFVISLLIPSNKWVPTVPTFPFFHSTTGHPSFSAYSLYSRTEEHKGAAREPEALRVMENGPPTIGFEDGTMDVQRLLVEPQDGHVSVDSVMCFNEKIPENSINLEEVSRSFGGTNTCVAQENRNILNGDVLDSMRNEVEVGYFRMQNDFCSMGDDYLLGVEFAESITNLDYSLSGGLPTSVSDCPILPSAAGINTSWKEDPFRIMEMSKCCSDRLNIDSSDYGEISDCRRESETLAEEKPLESPTSRTLPDLGKFNDISSCSFQLSDENDSSHSPSAEVLSNPKNEKIDEFVMTGLLEQDRIITVTTQASCIDTFPKQKRSRKPTQRYIDEVTDPVSRHCKKRREISASTVKGKSLGVVHDHKKTHMVSRAVRLPAEEPSVKAIQVPFGSLVHKECPLSPAHEMLPSSEGGNPLTKSNHLANPENDKKRDECSRGFHLRKRDDRVKTSSMSKRDETVHTPCLVKKLNYPSGTHSKKRDYNLRMPSQKKWGDYMLVESPKKGDDCLAALRQMKKDYYLAPESPEEVSGRRKHHRLWTVAEVRKLIDGVSKYGVGRWSRIKKLFFSSSTHRTAVDLKDKWRNLLKASGIQGQGNQQGEKKRNLAWRPLPKSILRRVCELATMYPYPKGRKPPMIMGDSPDRSTDITLSDYRRILRSINGN